jgi:hypothetical protein
MGRIIRMDTGTDITKYILCYTCILTPEMRAGYAQHCVTCVGFAQDSAACAWMLAFSPAFIELYGSATISQPS